MFKISDEDIMSLVKKSLEKEAKQRGLIREVEEGGEAQKRSADSNEKIIEVFKEGE